MVIENRINGYIGFDTEAQMMLYISEQFNTVKRFIIFDKIAIQNELQLLTFLLGFQGMGCGKLEPSAISFDLYDDYPSFVYACEYFSLEWSNKYWFYDQGVQRMQWIVKLTIPEAKKL